METSVAKSRESRHNSVPCAHIQPDNLVSRVISASFFAWKFPLFIDGASRFTPKSRFRSWISWEQIRREANLRWKKKGGRAEGGKCTQRFTEFLEQCEIKAAFNWRQRSAPLQTSNFLISLFMRWSTIFYLTKKMHFLVNIPLLFTDCPGGWMKRLLKMLRRFHKSRTFLLALNDFFLYTIFQSFRENVLFRLSKARTEFRWAICNCLTWMVNIILPI